MLALLQRTLELDTDKLDDVDRALSTDECNLIDWAKTPEPQWPASTSGGASGASTSKLRRPPPTSGTTSSST